VADGYVVDALTISGGTVNNSVIGGSTAAAGTFTQVDVTGEGDLRLQDTSGGQYVGFDAPATVSTSYTLTFPAAIGSVDQLLTINNVDGTLQWATAASTTPGGSDTQVQYNDGGSTFGGDAGLVYNDSTNLLTVDGVATEGIVFPATQVASSGVNTLDDYEEGSWDPELGGSTSESGQSYNTDLGVYIKIGRIVYCSYYIAFADKGTIVGSLQIKNLPFVAPNPLGGTTFGYWTVAGNIQGLQGSMGATFVWVQKLTTAGATPVNMTTSDINDSTTLVGSFTYSVA
jgi:hypothetical protein